jgi:predicted secreted protein
VSLTTAFAIYFIVWWLVLFAVLPWGIRSQHETGDVVPGSDPGAPMIPRLARKLILTTVISLGVFVLGTAIYRYRLIPFDDFSTWVGIRN